MKTILIIALILAAICLIVTFYYKSKYNEMVAAAGTKRALRRLELSPEFEGVCSHGATALRLLIFFIIIAAIIAALMAWTAFGSNTKKSLDDELATDTTEAYADTEEYTENDSDDVDVIPDSVVFYNDKVQENGDGAEFNFGPSAYTEGISGSEARAELLDRCRQDPVLLAAVDSWLDANLGTNLCGVFYEDNAEWRQAVNDYAEAMAYDPDLFSKSYEATAKLVQSAKPSVEQMGSDITDQMYMLPKQYSGNEIPQLIVCSTKHSKGHYLALKFNIKGDDSFVVKFRLECGFQPTNCSKKLETKPTAKPTKKKPGNGGGNNPTNPTKPPSPKPPTPTPSNGDGCNDSQTWTPSGGQQVERRTDTPSGGGNSHDNSKDPPSGGATRVDQGSGGGERTPDKPKDPPAVDSGNGMVSGDD